MHLGIIKRRARDDGYAIFIATVTTYTPIKSANTGNLPF